MDTKKLLIIPDKNNIADSIAVAKRYNCGFEYNDFFHPDVLDNQELVDDIVKAYQGNTEMPEYSTLHGAFLDVTIFTQDKRVYQVSDLRVEQSISVARRLGAKAVVFHTNYISNFRQETYRNNWVDINARYWKEKLEKYPDISIYIENMFDDDYEPLLRLADRMKDVNGFGVCLDYAHACVFGDEQKVDEWCKNLGPYVKHVHINDNDLECDLHHELGTGKIDWTGFKKNYKTYFPEATVLVEMNGVEKILGSLEYLKKL